MECTPNKESLLALVKPDMHLTKEFLKRIYSFELDYPGFAEQAIAALESAGCSRARRYYEDWVAEYEAAYKAEIKEAAKWYMKECEKRWDKKQKGSEEQRTRKEVDSLRQMSNEDLIALLESLTGAN